MANADIQRSLLTAAVVGQFDPMKLSGNNTDALVELANHSDEYPSDNTMRWRLRSEMRRKLLAQIDDDMLQDLISETDSLVIENDAFGTFLRRALTGDPVNPAKRDVAELQALQTALGFAEARLVERGQEDTAKRRNTARRTQDALNRIAKESQMSALASSAPEELFGRKDEKRAIRRFMAEGTLDEPYRTVDQIGPDHWLLWVSGIGGTGKSALISDLVYRTRRWRGSAPILHFDFDRHLLASANVFQLMHELTRQLELSVDDRAGVLSAYRKRLRNRSGRYGDGTRNLTRGLSILAHNIYDFRAIIKEILDPETPLTLVFDTFEEVLVKPPAVANLIMEWVDLLRRDAGLKGLRVILASRAEVPTDPAFDAMRASIAGHIPLDDLDKPATVRMLQKGGFDRSTAGRAFDAFGGNPFVVVILIKYCLDMSKDEINALFKEGKGNEAFHGEIAQRFLYSRVLGRLQGDEYLSKLANPGLALRRLTAQLVREVLAKPCGLNVSAPKLAELYDQLAQHVWLVQPLGDGVRHERKLRRMMLPMVTRDKPIQVQAIHEAAAEFYIKRRDETLSPEEQADEAIYHALMIGREFVLNADNAPRFSATLGGDIEDLPPSTQAKLRLLSSDNAVLSDEQIEALKNDDLKALARERRLTASVNSGGSNAFDAWIDEREAVTRAVTQQANEPAPASNADGSVYVEADDLGPRVKGAWSSKHTKSDIAAAFADLAFEYLTDFVNSDVQSFVSSLISTINDSDDAVQTKEWRAALAVLAMGETQDLREAVTREMQRYGDSGKLPPAAYILFRIVGGVQRADAGDYDDTLRELARVVENVVRRLLGRKRNTAPTGPFRVLQFLRSQQRLPSFNTLTVEPGLIRIFTPTVLEAVMSSMDRQLFYLSSELPTQLEPGIKSAIRVKPGTISGLEDVAGRIEATDTFPFKPGLKLPEIYGPLSNALGRSIKTARSAAEIIDEIEHKVLIWPEQFSAKRVASAKMNKTLTSSLVESADRAGVLGDLLALSREQNDTFVLRRAQRLFLRYEQILRGEVSLYQIR